MGYSSALDMRAHADEDTALRCHLQHNHFPTVPEVMIPVAKQALYHARRGEWSATVALPDRITLRNGDTVAPVHTICRALHLDVFLDAEE